MADGAHFIGGAMVICSGVGIVAGIVTGIGDGAGLVSTGTTEGLMKGLLGRGDMGTADLPHSRNQI